MFTHLDPSLPVSNIFFSHRSIASTILTSCASSVPYGNERPYMSLSDLGLVRLDRRTVRIPIWKRTMRSKPSVGHSSWDHQNLHLGFQRFFIFHPYLGKIPILTNIFQMSWNHQLVTCWGLFTFSLSICWVPRVWKKHNQIYGIHDPLWVFKSVAAMHSKLQLKFLGVESYCWWFRNPANPLICVSIPLFAGFWTSQVVISGFLNHQQSLYWL